MVFLCVCMYVYVFMSMQICMCRICGCVCMHVCAWECVKRQEVNARCLAQLFFNLFWDSVSFWTKYHHLNEKRSQDPLHKYTNYMLFFMWLFRDKTQVLMLILQVFYWLSHNLSFKNCVFVNIFLTVSVFLKIF